MVQARYHGNIEHGSFLKVFKHLLEDALLCLDEYIQCDAPSYYRCMSIILVFFVRECDFQNEMAGRYFYSNSDLHFSKVFSN